MVFCLYTTAYQALEIDFYPIETILLVFIKQATFISNKTSVLEVYHFRHPISILLKLDWCFDLGFRTNISTLGRGRLGLAEPPPPGSAYHVAIHHSSPIGILSMHRPFNKNQ